MKLLYRTGRTSTALCNIETLRSWIIAILSKLLSKDHKSIGTFYFIFAIVAGISGIILSLKVYMEIDEVGNIVRHSFFAIFSEDFITAAVPISKEKLFPLFSLTHILIVIIFMTTSALFYGFGNWLVPLLIGTNDMAYPRLNRAGFWLFVFAFALFIAALFYLPGNFMTAIELISALHIAAISAILSATNFIVTIIVIRIPSVRFSDMLPFVWIILIASFLMLLCIPLMTGATTLLLCDYMLQTQKEAFYILSQFHVMLWFIGHPGIYALLLLAFGNVSHIIAEFSENPLYAQKGIAMATAAISLSGFVLWTQNLFHDASFIDMQIYFFYSVPIIGLLTTFIVFSWFLTIKRRWPICQVPMLWAAGFTFILILAIASILHLGLTDAFPNASIVFISHFYYVLLLSTIFSIFAGWYFWFPKISGFIICDLTSRIHFWVTFVAVNLVFLPQYFQKSNYESQSFSAIITDFINWAHFSSVGTFILACSFCIFLYSIVETLIRRKSIDEKHRERSVLLRWE
ncbi:MAG: cytochrome c oxidase subunit I [Candidatus Tokpelaia sp. JSC188]|nr:MAG: cytochrome c oxidase subunit I [Candidatus Tokpelaia sp. JSC188]